jgi:hypothetical protein
VLVGHFDREHDLDVRVEGRLSARREVGADLEANAVGAALERAGREQVAHAPVGVGLAAGELAERAAVEVLEAQGDAARGAAERDVENMRGDRAACAHGLLSLVSG